MPNKHIISILSPYKWKLMWVVAVNIISLIFSIATMLLIEPLVKLIFQGEMTGLSFLGEKFVQLISTFVDIEQLQASLFALVGIVVAMFLFKNAFLFLTQWLLAPIRSDVIRNLRNQMYQKILLLPLSFFTNQKKGDIISRAVNDTQEIEVTILNAFQLMITSCLTVLIYLVVLFIISYPLTLFTLLLLPIVGGCISLITRRLRKKSLEAKQLLGTLFSHIEESMAGLRVIKGMNAQQHAEHTFDKHNRAFTTLQTRLIRRADLSSPMSEFLGVSAVMGVLIFGGTLVLSPNSTLSAAMFITYIALFSQIVNPAKNIGTAIANFKRGISALDRLYEILDAKEVIVNQEDASVIKEFQSEISLHDVHFAYSETPVLKGVSFSIKKGETVALVGASGAGKSTIADLLPRFYDIEQGEILIDGKDIKSYDLNDLRALFAIVSQQVVLFNDTLYNNITLGLPTATDEQVRSAAALAHALPFIDALPHGLNTVVGDRGLTLSGGQRQRISIARAILRNAPIIILDEATSAMDTESEKLVQDALNQVMKDRTSLVIAHRLSTIRNADKIIVLDAGEIVEVGTHQSLMERQGKYYHLVQINQFQS